MSQPQFTELSPSRDYCISREPGQLVFKLRGRDFLHYYFSFLIIALIVFFAWLFGPMAWDILSWWEQGEGFKVGVVVVVLLLGCGLPLYFLIAKWRDRAQGGGTLALDKTTDQCTQGERVLCRLSDIAQIRVSEAGTLEFLLRDGNLLSIPWWNPYLCPPWVSKKYVRDVQYIEEFLRSKNVNEKDNNGATAIPNSLTSVEVLVFAVVAVGALLFIRDIVQLIQKDSKGVHKVTEQESLERYLHDEQERAELNRKECNDGDMNACILLGYQYDQSFGVGSDVDHARATELYRRACDSGYMQGCYSLAKSYEEGRSGVPQDLARAGELYRRVATAYKRCQGVWPGGLKGAADLYQKACHAIDCDAIPDTCRKLGRGQGVR